MIIRFAALGAALAAMPAAALADTAADTSFTVGEIVVTARAMAGSSSNVLTSIDRLGADKAQAANFNYAWELVGRLPGVMLTSFNQGTTSGKFSFRGFNGEGEINAVKLLIDGIPSNSNDGNMPYIDSVFALDVAGIEVVRGTSDPRYGLHYIAGNANIQTRIGGTYLDARATAGSHATYEGQVSAGYETGRLSQNYLAAYRESGGYRRHGDLDRLSLAGKWFYDLTDVVRLGAVARYYRSNAQEPGYLTQASIDADPRHTNAYNESDGGRRRIQQYSLHLDGGDHGFGFSAKAYYNRLRDDRYVKFSPAPTSLQQRRVTREDHWGALAAVHYHVKGLMLEVGGDIQKQDNGSRRYLTVRRVVSSQTRDQQFDLTVGGVYAQAIIEPADWVRITPAWRLDWVGGDFTDRLPAVDIGSPVNDYGTISQPKLSVALTPLPGVTVYGNWGKTFQIGVGSGAYLIPPRLTDVNASINEGWEGGVKLALGEKLEGRIAWWQQTASGELKRKLNDPLGDFENLGATRRKGLDVQLSANPVQGLSFWGAIAWQEGVIRRADPATPQLKGNDIDHVPHWMFSGGVDVSPVEALRFSLWGNGQSAYELTTANAQGRFGDYVVLNGEIAWAVTKQLNLSFQIENLTDEFHEYVWWDGTQSLHSAAGGRSAYVTARVRF